MQSTGATNSKNSAAATLFVSNIALDIILTLITCGIYHLFIQNRKIKALNYILEVPKYSFFMWLVLTIITCSLYNIYHQYVLTADLEKASNRENSSDPILLAAVSAFGLGIIGDAIFQNKLNGYFGNHQV